MTRKTWTEEERKTLRDLYALYSNDEIAKRLNRSRNSVNAQASLLGLGKTKRTIPYWTPEELAILRVEFQSDKQVITQLSKKLGRSKDSVRRKAYELGLGKKGKTQLFWSEEEDFLMNKLALEGRTRQFIHAQINRKFGTNRSLSAVRKRLYDMGFTSNALGSELARIEMEEDGWTLPSLAELLSCSESVIRGWLKDQEIRKILAPRRLEISKGRPYFFKRANLKKFAKKYPMTIASVRPDIFWLIDLLTN